MIVKLQEAHTIYDDFCSCKNKYIYNPYDKENGIVYISKTVKCNSCKYSCYFSWRNVITSMSFSIPDGTIYVYNAATHIHSSRIAKILNYNILPNGVELQDSANRVEKLLLLL